MNPALERALQDCANEPIHLSGAIQPHGYLVSCSPSDWRVRQASANVVDLLDVDAAALLGQDLREFVADEVIGPVTTMIGLLEPGESPQRVASANIGVRAQHCDVVVHVAQGLVHLEFEPGDYDRSFVLSEDFDAARIEAVLKDGVLTLRLPRAAEAQPSKIQVKAA